MPQGTKRYWLLAAVLVLAAIGYWDVRGIKDRYYDHKLEQKAVDAKRHELEARERQVAEAQQKLEQLDKDPVEIEANIRQWSKKVREGEIIFRVDDVSEQQTETP